MVKSLKYINSVFEKYAEDSPEIQMYKTSKKEDLEKSDNLSYPLMLSSYEGDTEFKRGEVIISVSMLFLDRLLSDESNIVEVLSDTMLMAYDFQAKLYANENLYKFLLQQDSIFVTPVVASYDDNVAGYEMNIKVKLRAFRNEFQIPTF